MKFCLLLVPAVASQMLGDQMLGDPTRPDWQAYDHWDENKLRCAANEKAGVKITYDPQCLDHGLRGGPRGRDGDGGLGCIEEDNVPTGCRYCEFAEFASIPCDNYLFNKNQEEVLIDVAENWKEVGKDAALPDWEPFDTWETNKVRCAANAKAGEQITFDPQCIDHVAPGGPRGRDGDGGLGCIEEEGIPTGCRYCEFKEFATIPCNNFKFNQNQKQVYRTVSKEWRENGIRPAWKAYAKSTSGLIDVDPSKNVKQFRTIPHVPRIQRGAKLQRMRSINQLKDRRVISPKLRVPRRATYKMRLPRRTSRDPRRATYDQLRSLNSPQDKDTVDSLGRVITPQNIDSVRSLSQPSPVYRRAGGHHFGTSGFGDTNRMN